jgi:hypothetical protein
VVISDIVALSDDVRDRISTVAQGPVVINCHEHPCLCASRRREGCWVRLREVRTVCNQTPQNANTAQRIEPTEGLPRYVTGSQVVTWLRLDQGGLSGPLADASVSSKRAMAARLRLK